MSVVCGAPTDEATSAGEVTPRGGNKSPPPGEQRQCSRLSDVHEHHLQSDEPEDGGLHYQLYALVVSGTYTALTAEEAALTKCSLFPSKLGTLA